jgi:hypothetical protein
MSNTTVEDEEEVIHDERTNETFVIPPDVATTDYVDAEGKKIPDRVLTILINEYGTYPEGINDFAKKGDLVTKDGKDGSKIEIQTYEHPKDTDPKTKKLKTITIKKKLSKQYYEAIMRLRNEVLKKKEEREEKPPQ